jgi:DNA-binding NtrC family response regulator
LPPVSGARTDEALKAEAEKRQDTVLIVDDRPEVLRALGRLLGSMIEHVYLAATPEQAEAVLQDFSPRCLLCDYWLGEGQPLATTLIPRWRRRYPCLQCAVMMTGTNSSSIPHCPDIDIVLQKPLDVDEVVGFFASHGDQAADEDPIR